MGMVYLYRVTKYSLTLKYLCHLTNYFPPNSLFIWFSFLYYVCGFLSDSTLFMFLFTALLVFFLAIIYLFFFFSLLVFYFISHSSFHKFVQCPTLNLGNLPKLWWTMSKEGPGPNQRFKKNIINMNRLMNKKV